MGSLLIVDDANYMRRLVGIMVKKGGHEVIGEAETGQKAISLYPQLKPDLVILDELGYITFDVQGAELLFHLLATRYETLSTIITTNLPFSEWVKVFHDKTLTAALLDRITHRAMIVNMNGTSYRRRAMNN